MATAQDHTLTEEKKDAPAPVAAPAAAPAHKSLWSAPWVPKLDLRSMIELYPQMRFLMWFFQTEYSQMVRFLANRPFIQRQAERRWQKENPGKTFNPDAHGIKDKPWQDPTHPFTDTAQRYSNALEGVVFLALSSLHFMLDHKEMLRDMAAPVAAELGIAPEKVGLLELWKSKNPLIKSEMHKFGMQTILRFGSDITFFFGLRKGIIFKSVDVVFENTVFRIPTAFHMLKDAIEKAQTKTIDPARAQGNLADALSDVLQTSRAKEFHEQAFSETTLKGLAPTLNLMAQAAVERKIGNNEILYLIGQIANNADHSRQNLLMAQQVISRGLGGVGPGTGKEKGAYGAIVAAGPRPVLQPAGAQAGL